MSASAATMDSVPPVLSSNVGNAAKAEGEKNVENSKPSLFWIARKVAVVALSVFIGGAMIAFNPATALIGAGIGLVVGVASDRELVRAIFKGEPIKASWNKDKDSFLNVAIDAISIAAKAWMITVALASPSNWMVLALTMSQTSTLVKLATDGYRAAKV